MSSIDKKEQTYDEWKSLKITNDFIFSKFMSNPERCKEVLEILLPFKVGKIEYINSQESIQERLDTRGVRLDVYVKDSDKIYNIEMQVGSYGNLPKRSRYYGSAIDVDNFKKGKDYNRLKETFIIFICTSDPFDKDLPCYSFENICKEDKDLSLKDGKYTLFFNAEAYSKEENKDRRDFLAFITGDEVANASMQSFSNEIEKIKDSEQWRNEYMNLFAIRLDEAEARGIQLGEARGIQLGEARGIQLGEARGIQLGKVEGLLEAAKNFLDILDDKTIALKTKLPLKEIQKLRQASLT